MSNSNLPYPPLFPGVITGTGLPPAPSTPVGTLIHNPQNGTTSVVTAAGNAVLMNSGTGPHWAQMKQTVTFTDGEGRSVTVDEIIDFMEIMKKRMLMLTPAMERHEHYPALKEAYEHYLAVERMCCGDEQKGP